MVNQRILGQAILQKECNLFAAQDPLRVIPCIMAASAVSSTLFSLRCLIVDVVYRMQVCGQRLFSECVYESGHVGGWALPAVRFQVLSCSGY